MILLSYFVIVSFSSKIVHSKKVNDIYDIKSLLPDRKEIATKIDNNGYKTDLWLAGTYIAAHKYFGADFRYLTGNVGPDDQVFYKKFPSPTLRDLDPKLIKQCDYSASSCVNEVLISAEESGSLQHLMKNKELPTFAPFSNDYEDFRFRQTAMYYLCWYTKMEDSYLKFTVGDVSCLEHLNAVDEIPKEKRKRLVEKDELPINDLRNDNYKNDPFICANLWFCPDPCYGREDHGNFVKSDYKVAGNPCLDLKNSECKWKKSANNNFKDLIRNKFNVTCDCTSERKGFHWNSQFGICVDTDECYEKKHKCPKNRICKNTVGKYVCTCLRGYDVNPETDECERLLTMHESATILEYVKREEDPPRKTEETDLISELMYIAGLSRGSSNSIIEMFNFLYMYIIFGYLNVIHY